MVSRPRGRLATVAVVGEGHTPQPPELDAGRLLQDAARGEARDLGQEALDAAAAVGAGQVKAAQGGGRGATPLIRRPVSGFATDRS